MDLGRIAGFLENVDKVAGFSANEFRAGFDRLGEFIDKIDCVM